MTTAELTMQINRLTVAEQNQVGHFVETLLRRRTRKKATNDPWQEDLPIRFATGYFTKDELVDSVRESVAQAQAGHTISYEEHRSRIKERYGLSI